MAILLNLRDFLPGTWRFTRTINGFFRQDTIDMQGKAFFVHNGADLAYDEVGHYCYEQQLFSFKQTYIYQWGKSGYTVCFRDGRFFYNLTMHEKVQDIIHKCGQDQYNGLFVWHGANTWALQWRILGPVKNFTIETTYEREI